MFFITMKRNLLLLLILFFPAFSVFAVECPINSSFDDLSQSCQCDFGYISVNKKCFKAEQYCKDSFGVNSRYNETSEKCECNYGYIASFGQCIGVNNYCQDKNGLHSTYDFTLKTCKCTSGYVLINDNCIDANEYCKNKFGAHASFDAIEESCACSAGYKIKNNKCTAPQISGVSVKKVELGSNIVVTGSNFGEGLSDSIELYVGYSKVSLNDIIGWQDEKIVFSVADYLESGNVILKVQGDLVVTGPYVEIIKIASAPEVETQIVEKGTTINQQVTINAPLNTPAQEPAKPAESKQSMGFFDFLSSFIASISLGLRNVFASIMGA